MPSLAEQAVDAIDHVSGRHPGYRSAHAKGIVCRGRFEATPRAAALTRAAHMQGDPVDAIVRFSHASGDPATPDWARDARGMSAKLLLPGGARTDIVAVTLPCFFARRAEDFIAFVLANEPSRLTGRPRLRKVAAHLLTHPEALRATAAAIRMRAIPSYATCRYNALHAFRWIAPDGSERHVRYSWLPAAGLQAISRRKARRRGPDYLQRELGERLAREPVRFTLCVQLAAGGDRVHDPTATWPKTREVVPAGTLELTELDSERERGGDVLVFDPTRVTDGIELSADPLLRFRTYAYSVSVERRSGVPRPAALDGGAD